MFNTQAELDSFKANFHFFGETEDNYNIVEIETQAQLDAFQKCADFTSLGDAESGCSGDSGGAGVDMASGKSGSDRKLRNRSKVGVSGSSISGVSSVSSGGSLKSPTSVDSKVPGDKVASFLASRTKQSIPSVGGAPLSPSASCVSSVAVTPPSGSGVGVSGAGLVQDVDSMQDYLSSIWRNQEGSHGNTVFWEVQYVPLNREFCVAVIDFQKKRTNNTETHWAHKPDCHNFCLKVLLENKEDLDASRAPRHKKVRPIQSLIPEFFHHMGYCHLRATPGSSENLPRKITGTNYDIKKMVWYSFLPLIKSDNDVKELIGEIAVFFLVIWTIVRCIILI